MLLLATLGHATWTWLAPPYLEASRNAELQACGRQVWDALIAFTLDQPCCYRFPEAREVEAALIGPENYLPGRRLPPNPWADPPRPIRIVVDRLPPTLPTLVQLRDEKRYARFEQVRSIVVGPGRMPGSAPPDAYTYGTLVYLVDPIHAVLLGIGQAGDKAQVVYYFNNMGGWSALPGAPRLAVGPATRRSPS